MRILLVDDQGAVRRIVQRLLRTEYPEGTIAEASNGADALEILRKETFDLVLCDWNMPQMSGIEMLEQLRQEGIAVRLGFLTCDDVYEHRTRARCSGAKFLLRKPFGIEAFREALALSEAPKTEEILSREMGFICFDDVA